MIDILLVGGGIAIIGALVIGALAVLIFGDDEDDQ
jgi:hypothetical protein